jgi:hypothetical protein
MGLIYILEKIVHCIQQEIPDRILNVKLYGGWYENRRFTTLAQSISRQLDSFPRHVFSNDGKKLTLVPELARNLEALPRQEIYHTYRVHSLIVSEEKTGQFLIGDLYSNGKTYPKDGNHEPTPRK